MSFFTDLIKCSARGSSHGWIDCWVSRRYIYLSIYLSYLICARSDLVSRSFYPSWVSTILQQLPGPTAVSRAAPTSRPPPSRCRRGNEISGYLLHRTAFRRRRCVLLSVPRGCPAPTRSPDVCAMPVCVQVLRCSPSPCTPRLLSSRSCA